MSVICDRSVVFSGYSGFLHQGMTEILLRVALNTIALILKIKIMNFPKTSILLTSLHFGMYNDSIYWWNTTSLTNIPKQFMGTVKTLQLSYIKCFLAILWQTYVHTKLKLQKTNVVMVFNKCFIFLFPGKNNVKLVYTVFVFICLNSRACMSRNHSLCPSVRQKNWDGA